MSFNVVYSFREGIRGLKRARLSAALTISTMVASLSLFGLFLLLTLNIQKIMDTFRHRIAIEVFVDNGLEPESLNQLKNLIESNQGVKQVYYISPDEALERFKRDFGEDPIEIFGENPLPGSFHVQLIPTFLSPAQISRIAESIESMKGVDEAVFHGELMQIIHRYSRIILGVDIVLAIIVFLTAILLISNTLKMTIFAQRENIKIMELVGATPAFIQRPYLIQGVIQGGLGGLIASLIIIGIVQLVRMRFPNLIQYAIWQAFAPIGLGLIMGYIGSRISLNRFLLR